MIYTNNKAKPKQKIEDKASYMVVISVTYHETAIINRLSLYRLAVEHNITIHHVNPTFSVLLQNILRNDNDN